jgi:ribA/ribD-fused uncharacterized protein
MKYNNGWLKETYTRGEPLSFLFFWGHTPAKDGSVTKSCFSQWWLASFELDGKLYPTAEHWMMAGKAKLFKDNKIEQKILDAKTPAEVKKLGRLVKGFDATAWNAHKFDIVVKGNLLKFSQHDSLQNFLLATGNNVLVEASPVDAVCGIGMAADHVEVHDPTKWKGQNLLGYALMEVRDELRNR